MFEFDNQRPDAFLTEVAQGYVRLLEPMRWYESAEATPRGPYLRQLDITHHQPRPHDIESRWLKHPPAVIVHVVRASPEGYNHGSIDWRVHIDVHLFSGHAGGDAAGRIALDRSEGRTTLHDPGVHVMVQHVTEYLHGGQPTPYCPSSIIPSDVKRIGDSATWAWWLYETEVLCRQAIHPERDMPALDGAELIQQTPEAGDTVVEQRRVY